MENISNKEKLSIGQTIYIVPSYHYKNRSEPEAVKISKIGKKYFELEEKRGKFSIETLRGENETNYRAQCYFTLQEILDEREYEAKRSKIRNIFTNYGKLDLNIEQLRAIVNIIDNKNKL